MDEAERHLGLAPELRKAETIRAFFLEQPLRRVENGVDRSVSIARTLLA